MRNFFISKSLFSFGYTSSSLFLPVYLYQLHFDTRAIFIFFCILRLFEMMSSFPVIYLCSKFGTRYVIGGGIMLYSSLFTLLHVGLNLQEYNYQYFCLAVLAGVSSGMYYNAYHLFMTHQDACSKQIAKVSNIGSVMAIASPFIGGALTYYFGFDIMYYIMTTVMLSAFIPLYLSSNVNTEEQDEMPTVKQLLEHVRNNKKESSALFFAFGFDCHAFSDIWPLFIIVMGFSEILGLGMLYTLIPCLALFVTHYVGHSSFQHQKRNAKLGIIGLSLTNLAPIFATTPLLIPITILRMVNEKLVYLPIDALSYQRANSHNRLLGIMYRETTINGGGALLFAIASVTNSFSCVFIITAFAVLTHQMYFSTNK